MCGCGQSKTDQEAHGSVKALPYGRDPATCPPCAYVRWREVLHAADTADADDPGAQRKAVLRVLRRQAAFTSAAQATVGEGRSTRTAMRLVRCMSAGPPACTTRPTRAGCCSRRCTRPARSATGAMTGHAVNEMIRRRAAAAGFTPAQTLLLGGHSLRAGFVTEAFRQGADAHAIMRQTGHRSPAMLEVYAREHAPLVGQCCYPAGSLTMPARNRCNRAAALSERTLRTYAADWALFVDWCDATDQTALPADPATVLEFLAGCPAAARRSGCG